MHGPALMSTLMTALLVLQEALPHSTLAHLLAALLLAPPLHLVLGTALDTALDTADTSRQSPSPRVSPFRATSRGPESGRVTLVGKEASDHRLIIGLTGAGKSACLASLIVQLINQGIACFVLDPHDLCERVLRLLCQLGFYRDQRAFERVLWVPFGRPGYSPAYNVHDQSYEAHDIARNDLLAFQRAWSALSGGNAPVVENMVLACSYLLARKRLPITLLGRVLTDAPFRERLLADADDEEIIRFFRRFDAAGRRAGLLSESTLRRTFSLGYSYAVRYSLGQLTNTLQLADRLARGTSLLLDLSGLDEDSKRLIGCLLMVDLEVALLHRAGLPAAALRPVHAFIDEAPVFIAQSAIALEHLLAQSRKYGACLTLSAQYLAAARKLQPALQNATLIAFRLGAADAEWATPLLFTPDPYRLKERPDMRTTYMSLAEQRAAFEQDLMRLPPREGYVRLREGTTKFRAVLLPPEHEEGDEGDVARAQLDDVQATYVRSLLTPHAQVEAALWAQLGESDAHNDTQSDAQIDAGEWASAGTLERAAGRADGATGGMRAETRAEMRVNERNRRSISGSPAVPTNPHGRSTPPTRFLRRARRRVAPLPEVERDEHAVSGGASGPDEP